MREQMNKKKEWWEEEGLGSESEEDNEKDIGKHIRNRFQQNVTDFLVFGLLQSRCSMYSLSELSAYDELCEKTKQRLRRRLDFFSHI